MFLDALEQLWGSLERGNSEWVPARELPFPPESIVEQTVSLAVVDCLPAKIPGGESFCGTVHAAPHLALQAGGPR